MKNLYGILVFGVLAVLFWVEGQSLGVADDAKKDQSQKNGIKSPKNEAKWREKMQELYHSLVEITTDTSSEQRFNSPENRSRIEKNAKKLMDRAHELGQKGVSPDADPTIQMIAGLFQDETKRAYLALKHGNRAYARGVLNQVGSYCIACHTRNPSGPSFTSLPLEPTSKTLSVLEQGRFYAATRQYDRAFDAFLKVVDDSAAPVQRPLEWEQAIRSGLSIAVRVKKDPDQAQSLVERVIGAKKAPFFLRQDALKWKESIAAWREEIPRRALTEEGLYVEAMQLIAQARELQKYPMDHAADVLYLRATAVLHELMQKAPQGRHVQDALFMAGVCYDVLRPLNLDDLHEIYYEACIKKVPHSPTAEVCYRRYEQSTYEGYTGSSGTHIPGEVREKLDQLEKLAQKSELKAAP